jgi:hypothetical protein
MAVALGEPTPGLELRWNLLSVNRQLSEKLLRLGRGPIGCALYFSVQKTDNMELLLVLEWLP